MDNRTLERRLEAKDKLIAELLEALESINEAINVDWLGQDEINLIREEAQLAIRKAKGE